MLKKIVGALALIGILVVAGGLGYLYFRKPAAGRRRPSTESQRQVEVWRISGDHGLVRGVPHTGQARRRTGSRKALGGGQRVPHSLRGRSERQHHAGCGYGYRQVDGTTVLDKVYQYKEYVEKESP